MIDFERRMNPPKITEIHKLHRMLCEAGVEHEYINHGSVFGKVDHWQICLYNIEGERVLSVVEGAGTYGAEDDLLEIMGLLTEEEAVECVVGWLTAENVFERIQEYLKYQGK